MSTRTHDESERQRQTDESRCAALELEDGQVILYDPSEHDAWIQSDVAVPLERETEATD